MRAQLPLRHGTIRALVGVSRATAGRIDALVGGDWAWDVRPWLALSLVVLTLMWALCLVSARTGALPRL